MCFVGHVHPSCRVFHTTEQRVEITLLCYIAAVFLLYPTLRFHILTCCQSVDWCSRELFPGIITASLFVFMFFLPATPEFTQDAVNWWTSVPNDTLWYYFIRFCSFSPHLEYMQDAVD